MSDKYILVGSERLVYGCTHLSLSQCRPNMLVVLVIFFALANTAARRVSVFLRCLLSCPLTPLSDNTLIPSSPLIQCFNPLQVSHFPSIHHLKLVPLTTQQVHGGRAHGHPKKSQHHPGGRTPDRCGWTATANKSQKRCLVTTSNGTKFYCPKM